METKGDDSPEEKLKLFEKKVTELIEESCLASSRGESQLVMNLSRCTTAFYSKVKEAFENVKINFRVLTSILPYFANFILQEKGKLFHSSCFMLIVKFCLFSGLHVIVFNIKVVFSLF